MADAQRFDQEAMLSMVWLAGFLGSWPEAARDKFPPIDQFRGADSAAKVEPRRDTNAEFEAKMLRWEYRTRHLPGGS